MELADSISIHCDSNSVTWDVGGVVVGTPLVHLCSVFCKRLEFVTNASEMTR